jgi:peptide-methionine (S)-S-oxide reductase
MHRCGAARHAGAVAHARSKLDPRRSTRPKESIVMTPSLDSIRRFLLAAALGGATLLAPLAAVAQGQGLARATFAGGCFWCMEAPFDKLPGVASTTAGYMGGEKRNPTYQEVSGGRTGHTEVVQVLYDPAKVSYEKLLEVFWRNIDPTVKDRQFCDVGSQYRTAIFVHDAEQKRLAEASRAQLEKSKPFAAPIVTPVETAGEFWPAEDYHQDFYKKNPVRYRYYRQGCGRDERLRELWGKAPE